MKSKDAELLARVRELMDCEGWSQVTLGQKLRVSQGHLSKIIAQKWPLSPKMRIRIRVLIAGAGADQSHLEARAISALRGSQIFRDLVIAALKMHTDT
jgi:hypothetical protein